MTDAFAAMCEFLIGHAMPLPHEMPGRAHHLGDDGDAPDDLAAQRAPQIASTAGSLDAPSDLSLRGLLSATARPRAKPSEPASRAAS